MLEEKDEQLQDNVGGDKKSETTEVSLSSEKSTEVQEKKEESTIEVPPMEKEPKAPKAEKKNAVSSDEHEAAIDKALTKEKESEAPIAEKEEDISNSTIKETTVSSSEKEKKAPADDKEEDLLEEIDESNAEDAEDEDNRVRHQIPILDYHSMSMENLVGELQRLVKNEKVQAIKKHIDGIKYEFDLKFQDFIEHKKEEYVSNGGYEIDFKYNSVTKRQFNEVYTEYREKRDQYYKSLEHNLKDNLNKRLTIIEELKGLVNVEEDINTTYKNFKDLQERWRTAGPIPRTNYNDVWRTYHHHIEIFYDFLHLNRELRDLDFKHNLEEKLRLIGRAESLANEPDLSNAFQELQTLHKIWKEDVGPVDREHRELIWEAFSNATKVLHQRRQDHYKDMEKVYEENLVKKNEIIESINGIAGNMANNHKALQLQMKKVEELRDSFFKAGKVPQKVNEQTWAAFKEGVRNFNRNKNAYYKNLKKDQQENLDNKRALLDLAVSLKDSDDYDTTTVEMKRIQNEWKKIGHVPRKYSDKIWNEFKDACNHYFDRLHSLKNVAHKEEEENLSLKNACLDKLKAFELSGDKQKDLASIKEFIAEWKTYGRVPFNKKNINVKFNKILDALFNKLDINRQEAELMKYGNKIQQLASADNERAIYNERTFIRRKITESKSEINQLENNLQFFSNASEDSPVVKEVIKNINNHKDALSTWKAKLKKLNILENNLNKEAEEVEMEENDTPEKE
ncbi:DUF349 domain-containing protein [Sediminicola arcticus]|jgi:hypothetical protein|uniref:DUF349 domain-containing protein n=1 Tax=Sediminicola arcticus TaxID=1574308 RepID=A0ABV2SST6_9FLAO